MSNPYWDAFFALHRDLPREGPGEPADVAWAADRAGVPPDARVCDAACGPGADIGALLAAAPEGHVTALDQVDQFVAQARSTWGHDPRVTLLTGDMRDLIGPFDFIWCAGAVYFLGIPAALDLWRRVLAPKGAVAFSQVCWFHEDRSPEAEALWADYADMTDEAGVLAKVAGAGYEVLGTRRLSDAAWEAYYTPMAARVAALQPGASGEMADVLHEAETEARVWRGARREFGYILCVVRPA